MQRFCKNLGSRKGSGAGLAFHSCSRFGNCCLTSVPLKLESGEPFPACESCPEFEAKPEFCYFSCDTTSNGPAMLATMVSSARRVGVRENFHVFTTAEVPGAIWHALDAVDIDLKYHIFKVKLLKQLSDLDYDYFVWLDSDNYFVRHPGNLSNLIRNNRIWVLMESEATSPLCKHKEWWGCPIPDYVRLLTDYGVTAEKKYNTNGGMWIVRKEAVAEFVDAFLKIHEDFLRLGYLTTHDETPLAVLGQHPNWVEDASLNTSPATAETWACDWQGVYAKRIPDGLPHVVEDWMTGEKRTANPAIVHAMRSKEALAGKVESIAVSTKKIANGAGTILSKYFSKFGYKAVEESETAITISDNINTASCGGCIALLNKMDAKGPDWCQLNIVEIFKGIEANAANRKVLGTPLNKLPAFKSVVLKFIDFAIAESKRLNGRNGKVVLITGVTRGLGLAMAKRFSELGDTVIGCGRSIEAIEGLQANFTGSRRFDVVDVTSDEQVAAWAALLASAQVYPDLIINNAGAINKPAKLQDITAEEFDSVLRTNLQGTVNVLRHFTADVVVNFSSDLGKKGGDKLAPYCASKYAIEGLTAAFAKELPEGKAVVAFNPGVIATAMLDVLGGKTKTTPEIWSREAVPFLLGLTARDNGKSLNLP